jgi:hypothetical protein
LTETEIANANEKNIHDSNAHDRVGEPGRQTDRGSEHTTEDSESDDVLWVDWEGTDDPASPKKCVRLRTLNWFRELMMAF